MFYITYYSDNTTVKYNFSIKVYYFSICIKNKYVFFVTSKNFIVGNV